MSNQGRFYPDFDEIVLLSAPAEVLLSRIEARTALRRGCTIEIDATRPLADVVTVLAELGGVESRCGAQRQLRSRRRGQSRRDRGR